MCGAPLRVVTVVLILWGVGTILRNLETKSMLHLLQGNEISAG